MPLTPKLKRFCEEFAIDFNATKAAERAGYSKKSAYSIGHENLKKPEVQEYLSTIFAKTSSKLEITRERVMLEMGRIAFSDIRKVFDTNGALKPMHELDEDTAAALAGIDTDELFAGTGDERKNIGYSRKVKLWAKDKALEMLAKHFKIYSDAPVTNQNIKFGYGPEQPA